MHTEPETLGKIIKAARQRSELTIEELAERIALPSDICIELKMRAKSQAMIFFTS